MMGEASCPKGNLFLLFSGKYRMIFFASASASKHECEQVVHSKGYQEIPTRAHFAELL